MMMDPQPSKEGKGRWSVANATASGAPLHIVHANSLSLGEIQVTLDMVASASRLPIWTVEEWTRSSWSGDQGW